jgi:hypothetical protein
VRLLFGIGAIFAIFAFAAGCGSTGGGGKVNLTLSEWSITADPNTVPKGPIEFTIKNSGQKQHDLVILRTNIPPDQLPTNSDGSVNTNAPDIQLEHTVDPIDSGDTTGRTYAMDPGTYVLISNMVDDNNGTKTAQYSQGMHTGFTVTEGSGSPTASPSASASPTRTPSIGSAGSTTPTATPAIGAVGSATPTKTP